MTLADRYEDDLDRLERAGVIVRGSRGTRSKRFLAERLVEWVVGLAGEAPPPLTFQGLGKSQAGATLVQTVCGHDVPLRALAAVDGLRRLDGDEDLVLHTSAGLTERQASASPGFLTNAAEHPPPSGARYSKQRGRQQTVFLATVAREKNPVLLATQPPNWSPDPPEREGVVGSSATLVRSGPAQSCARLVEPVVSAMALMPRSLLEGRLAVGGRLAARDGRAPSGMPLLSWSVEALQQLRRLGVIPALDLNASFRKGDPRRFGAHSAHAHFKRAGDMWTLEREATALPLPEALGPRERNVAVEIRYGEINGWQGAVVSVLSAARRADYFVFGEAHDHAIINALVEGLLAGHGHLRLAGGYVATLEQAAGHVGLRDVLGHGQEMPGLRAIGVLATNLRLDLLRQT